MKLNDNIKGALVIIAFIGALIGFGLLFSGKQNDNSSSSNQVSGTTNTQPTPSPKSPYDDPSQFTTRQFADVIGGYRIEKGVHALQEDPSLDAAARNHAYDMQVNNYNSSTSPSGVTDAQRIENAIEGTTYTASYWDNLCSGADTTSESSKLFESDQGEQYLSDPRYDYYGVGIVTNTATSGSCNGYLVVYYASVH